MHNTISMTYELKFNNAHDNDDEEDEKYRQLMFDDKYSSSECMKSLRAFNERICGQGEAYSLA